VTTRSSRGRSEGPAFEDLYLQFAEPVRRYVAGIVGEDSAQDVAQDVFLKAYQHHAEATRDVAGWLFHVARNRAVDHLRAGSRVSAEDPAAVARLSERAAEAQRPRPSAATDAAERLLEGLPTVQRQVLALRYRFGYSPADAGSVLHRSADSIRHLERRALERLRSLL
jgi:RNA polymerase sigma factor (sigma-70 family)